MRPWGPILVVPACALLPLAAPGAWVAGGWLPEIGVIAVVYLALSAGGERAALLGVAVGLLTVPWSAEPLGLEAFLLGGIGWAVGHGGRALERDRMPVRMLVTACAALVVRGGKAAAVLLATPDLPGAAPALLRTAALGAAMTALAAPVLFLLLARTGVFRRQELRARRAVVRV